MAEPPRKNFRFGYVDFSSQNMKYVWVVNTKTKRQKISCLGKILLYTMLGKEIYELLETLMSE